MKAVLAALVFAAGPALAQPPDFTALAREAGAAVVRVMGSAPPVITEYGPPPEPQLGSGLVIDASGYILTNAHLVSAAPEVAVRLADRRELEARLVGYDPGSDIALLKVEAPGLAAARIGDPRALRPGEWVVAIGAPFGFERSVTAGIVSGVGRMLPEASVVPFIQTDVAVNPGNSGGPLLNLRGEVVGVTSGFYSETGGNTGVSFAIPIDVAMAVATQLRTQGKVTRGVIGVRLQEITAELARALALPSTAGALVLEVFRGGAAERAKMLPGDVIVRFDGQPVDNEAGLVRLTAAAVPGSTVDVEFLRFGARLAARLRVDEARAPPMPPARAAAEALGLQVVALGARERRLLRLDGGLLVQREGVRQFLPLRLPR